MIEDVEMDRFPPVPRGSRPPMPGPGFAPGNVELTAAQEDPGVIGGGTAERPERYLLVLRRVGDEHDEQDEAGEPTYLFVRWPDWPYPSMLSMAPPSDETSLQESVATLLSARLRLEPAAAARISGRRTPVRMTHPRTGIEGLGWLRALAIEVRGEPSPDALLDGVEVRSGAEANDALPTDVERIVFRAGAELLD